MIENRNTENKERTSCLTDSIIGGSQLGISEPTLIHN
jgi:hypothetical protein